MTAQAGTGAPLLAGILGGSGTHVVQIIIGIVVVAAALSALVSFFVARRGVEAAAVTPASLHSSSDGTLRLERRWTSLAGTGGNALAGGNKPFTIAIDGVAVGTLAPKETVDVAVEPGHHTLRLSQGRHLSPERSFDVAQDEVVSFYCHGPRYGWPQLLAALVKPDVWITLRQI
ncbi:MAG TPA: hypothetical protein VMU65_02760 [Candidatus Saccharimonadales bacterium]|nr:hypothetical protein [Candidatus Saccharimonadales bacterium]